MEKTHDDDKRSESNMCDEKNDEAEQYESFSASSQIEKTAENDTIDKKSSKTKAEKENFKFDEDVEADFKLPELDWESLEAKLKIAQQEINMQNKRANLINDREEVRRKLAMVSSSSSSSSMLNNNNSTTNGTSDQNNSLILDYQRKPSLSKQHLLGHNLQICFMNELNNEEHSSSDTGQNHVNGETAKVENIVEECTTSKICFPSFSNLSLNSSENSYDNILVHLQNETKKALAKVPSEVKVTIQSEKAVSKKPSPIADIVGLSTYGLKRLERDQIVDMNIGQLQVIVNDLCNQIENINEELKKMLIDRDDLYMQQDSLLVDIEDLTRRIQEYMLRYKSEALLTMSYEDLTKSQYELSKSSNSDLSLNSPKRASKPTRNSNNNTAKEVNDNSSKLRSTFQLSNLTNRLYRFTKKT